jgi:hypothetical protein
MSKNEDVGWNKLAQKQDLMNTLMDLGVPQKAGHFSFLPKLNLTG